MKTMKLITLIGLIGSVLLATSCGDDDNGPALLELLSVTADGTDFDTGSATTGIDLFGAAAAQDVPLDAVIKATFSRDVDAATVSATNVQLTYAGGTIDAAVAVSGAVVTITPSGSFARGLDYSVSVASVSAVDGGTLSESKSLAFNTAGRADVDPPQAATQKAYWTMDGHINDELDAFNGTIQESITYTTDRFGQINSTASFDGDNSIIEVPNAGPLMDSDDFTLSFWVKSNSSDKDGDDNTRGQFVMGLAGWYGFQFEIFGNYGGCKLATQYDFGDGTSGPEDTWWSTEGNVGWQGWTFDQDVSGQGGLAAIMADQWVHVVCVYDATEKAGSLYMNGTLRKSFDFDLWPSGDVKTGVTGVKFAGNPSPGNNLAFGFLQGSENRIILDDWANPAFSPDNNHFKGELDDIRIFGAAYSATDVSDLYNVEKP